MMKNFIFLDRSSHVVHWRGGFYIRFGGEC